MNQTPADDPNADADLDLAFAMYLKACDSGELASREVFLDRFPEMADQLRELMEAADMIGQFPATGSAPSRPSPVDSGKSTKNSEGSIDNASDGSADRGGPDDTVQTPLNSAADRPAEGGRLAEQAGDATVGYHERSPNDSSGEFSGTDPAETLPVGDSQDDQRISGPKLPMDLGDYELLQVLGMGGMGVVYLAKQKDLDRLVAVKMIRSGMLAGESEVKRFYLEAKAAAKLRHPGIVAVHHFGRRAGHHFFSMQYIEGEDLHRILDRAPLPPHRAAKVVRDAARAIEHAHSRGVLHRDLKPGNVMIAAGDVVHVTDFGLAKHVGVDSGVTGSGTAVGTPNFMAPEQALGHSESATEQSDIYSLGAILFASIAGRPPIVGETIMQTLMNVAHQPAPLLRSAAPDVDADLEVIVAKCLEKRPEDRYASAGELAADLNRYLNGGRISARARTRVRRLVDWTAQIPLVAAVVGRPMSHASLSHRRFQLALLAAAAGLPLLFLLGFYLQRRSMGAMPSRVEIAGGLPGGLYTAASQHLADKLEADTGVSCHVEGTQGSWDNRQRLLDGRFDLAPLQASAVDGETLSVVAPLFYEAVHVLVRTDPATGQPRVEDVGSLAGHRIAVGPEGSGSRHAAEMVLDSMRLPADVCPRVVATWPSLQQSDDERLPDVAMICIGPSSVLVSQMLGFTHVVNENNVRGPGEAPVDETSHRPAWQLMPLPDVVAIALQHPTLRPMTIDADAYPGADLPATGVQTVGTTAFLVSRHDAPDTMVRAALEALYRPPTLTGLIPAGRAAEWRGLAFHPAARRYYAQLP